MTALFELKRAAEKSSCYAGLMQHIPAGRPIYGLQARGMNNPATLPATLEEMAADYTEQIRQVQTSGPYHLMGWSLGGLIAFAIASRLRHQGEQIELLALLDAYPHPRDKFLPFPTAQEILSGLVKDLGRDPDTDPLDLSTVMEFLRRDGDGLSILEERHMWAMTRHLGFSTKPLGSNGISVTTELPFPRSRSDGFRALIRLKSEISFPQNHKSPRDPTQVNPCSGHRESKNDG
jgi:thioesterase domain-containing protein